MTYSKNADLTIVILSRYNGRSGGIETWLNDFEKSICVKNKIDYKIITMANSTNPFRLSNNEIPFFKSWLSFPIWLLSTILWVYIHRKSLSQRILVLGTVPVALPFVLVKHLLGFRLFVSVRGQLVQDTRDLGKHTIITWFMKKLEGYIVKNAGIHANGYDTQKYLIREHNCESIAIPNCIKQDLVDLEGKLQNFRIGERIEVLHLGTIRDIKGVRYIFDEIKLFKKHYPNHKMTFTFAGKGDWRKYFIDGENPEDYDINFLGDVEVVERLISSYDIALHNSYGSGLSNSFLETTWMGLLPITPINSFYADYNSDLSLQFDRNRKGSLVNVLTNIHNIKEYDRMSVRKMVSNNRWQASETKYLDYLEL